MAGGDGEDADGVEFRPGATISPTAAVVVVVVVVVGAAAVVATSFGEPKTTNVFYFNILSCRGKQ